MHISENALNILCARVWPVNSCAKHATPAELLRELEHAAARKTFMRGVQNNAQFWCIKAKLFRHDDWVTGCKLDHGQFRTVRYRRYKLTLAGRAMLQWLRCAVQGIEVAQAYDRERIKACLRRRQTELLRTIQDETAIDDYRALVSVERYG